MKRLLFISILFLLSLAIQAQPLVPWKYTPNIQTDSIKVTQYFRLNGEVFKITSAADGQILQRKIVSGKHIWTNVSSTSLGYDSLRFDPGTGYISGYKGGTSNSESTTLLDGRYTLIDVFLDSIAAIRGMTPIGFMLKSEYDPANLSGQIVNINSAQTLTNKTLTQPAIADYTLGQHNHSNAVNGGLVNSDVIVEGSTNHFSPFTESAGNYILPSGNVGIGVSPSTKLDISGTTKTTSLDLNTSLIFDGTTITDIQTGTGTNIALATKNYVDDQIISAGGYTDEQAQDAVGGALDNGTIGDVVFTYNDATPKISGEVENDSHTHTGSTISGLSVSNFTSPNISNWTNNSNYTTPSYALTGDLGGTLASPTVVDDSHTHTTATLPGIDLLSSGIVTITPNYGANTLTIGATEVDGSVSNEIQNLGYTASTRVLSIDGTGSIDATLPLFTSTEAGLVPLSGGGTTNFLRADGTWAAASGGSSQWNTDTYGITYVGNVGIGSASNASAALLIEKSLASGNSGYFYNTSSTGTGINSIITTATDSYYGLKVRANFADRLIFTGAGSIDQIEQASSPATPATGYGRFYTKTDGKAYFKNDGGTEYDLTATGSGMTDPMTTIGDIPYRNASNVTSRLGIGTTGQVLTVTGGVPVWATPSTGSGTVTSVGLAMPSIFSVSVTPVTTTGTLTASLASQSAYTVFGNQTASSAVPTFGKLNINSISATGTPSSTTFLRGDGTWTLGSEISTSAISAFIKNKSATGIFNKAHSSIVIGDAIFLGERKQNPYVIKFSNVDDLTTYTRQAITGTGNSAGGLENVCYNSSAGKLYYASKNTSTGLLDITEVSTSDITSYTIHSTSISSTNTPVICTDNTYIYGATASSTASTLFKIRISDWTTVLTNTATNLKYAHAIAINTSRGEMYLAGSNATPFYFSKVNLSDLTFTEANISTYVNTTSDDLVYYDNGTVCKVFIPGEITVTGYNLAIVETTNSNAVSGASILPSYGLSIDGNKIFNCASSGSIQVFSALDPSNISTYPLTGYVPNEIITTSTGRMFLTHWDTSNSVLAEFFIPREFSSGSGTGGWTSYSGYVSPSTISNEVRIGSTTDLGNSKLQVSGDFTLSTNGSSALFSTFVPSGSNLGNIFIGGGGQSSSYSSSATDGTNNTSLGTNSLLYNTTGKENTSVGLSSMSANTTGSYNTAMGTASGASNTTGSFNVSIGDDAMRYGTAVSYNTAIGATALDYITGSSNTALGFSAGRYTTAAAQNQTSTNSVYLGYDTRASANGNTNEIVIGYSAVGRGSNTVTIGNSNTTNNYFTGQINLSALNTAPASATATGTTGEIRVTAGYIYVCTATNTWVRAALSTW